MPPWKTLLEAEEEWSTLHSVTHEYAKKRSRLLGGLEPDEHGNRAQRRAWKMVTRRVEMLQEKRA